MFRNSFQVGAYVCPRTQCDTPLGGILIFHCRFIICLKGQQGVLLREAEGMNSACLLKFR